MLEQALRPRLTLPTAPAPKRRPLGPVRRPVLAKPAAAKQRKGACPKCAQASKRGGAEPCPSCSASPKLDRSPVPSMKAADKAEPAGRGCDGRGPPALEAGPPLIYDYKEVPTPSLRRERSMRPSVGYAQEKLNIFLRELDGTLLIRRNPRFPGDVARAKAFRAQMTPAFLNVDCWFGDQTELATRTFQAAMGLKPDGKIGPVTWPVLRRCGSFTLPMGQRAAESGANVLASFLGRFHFCSPRVAHAALTAESNAKREVDRAIATMKSTDPKTHMRVEDAAWMMFLDDDPGFLLKLQRDMEVLSKALDGSSTYSCGGPFVWIHCDPKTPAFTKWGNIYICETPFLGDPPYYRARTMIHEHAHRDLHVHERAGYFSVPGCENTSASLNKGRADRIDSADPYACFPTALLKTSHEEAEARRGRMMLVQTPPGSHLRLSAKDVIRFAVYPGTDDNKYAWDIRGLPSRAFVVVGKPDPWTRTLAVNELNGDTAIDAEVTVTVPAVGKRHYAQKTHVSVK